MRVNKQDLKSIIDEELSSVLLELNAYHSPKTGKLSSGAAGDVYSLSRPAVKAAGWPPEKAKKGIQTQKGKTRGKFGMPDKCGRKKISGQKINPTQSCSKFPKKYGVKEDGHPLIPSKDDSESDRLDKLGLPHGLRALGKGIVRADEELEMDFQLSIEDIVDIVSQVLDQSGIQRLENNNSELVKSCHGIGMISMADAQARVLRGVNNAVLAADGKLYGDK